MNGVGYNVTNIPKGSYALLIEGYSVGESKCGHQVHLGKEKVLPHLPTPSCPTPPSNRSGTHQHHLSSNSLEYYKLSLRLGFGGISV